MSSLQDPTKFAVIKFNQYSLKNGVKAVELVPRSWVHAVSNAWFCKYPPDNEIHHVLLWVEQENVAQDYWFAWEVDIISEAKNYHQELRRLQRSYTSEVLSTENESPNESLVEKDPLEIPTFHAENIDVELNNLPILCHVQSIQSTSHEKSTISNEKDSIEEVHQQPKKRKVSHEDLENLEKRIGKGIRSMRRSIQYDMQAFFNNISSNLITEPLGKTIPQLQEMSVSIPTEILEDFENFYEEISQSIDKENALKLWMTRMCIGLEGFPQAIGKILGGLIRKAFQLEYTACERKMKGSRKKNFSDTKTFKCMTGKQFRKFSFLKRNLDECSIHRGSYRVPEIAKEENLQEQ